MRRPCAPHRLGAALAALVALAAAPSGAQSSAAVYPPPERCKVVLEDMGEVGLRISDAAVLADVAMTSLKKRLGEDAVVFEGVYTSAAQMKRMLGAGAEASMQDAQLAYYQAAMKAAPYRVRVRFGTSGKKRGQGGHWATVTCRRADAGKKDLLDEARLEAPTFQALREALAEKMPTFCGVIAPAPAPAAATSSGAAPAGAEGGPPAWMRKKKATSDWTPPPVRE